jgi:hypothetical protein
LRLIVAVGRFAGDRMLLGQPRTEVYEATARAAERTVRKGFRPFDRASAGWTEQGLRHAAGWVCPALRDQEQQISVKGTSASVCVGRCSMPCHSRKRRLQR